MRQSQRRQKNFTQPCHGEGTPTRLKYNSSRRCLWWTLLRGRHTELNPTTWAGNPKINKQMPQFWFFLRIFPFTCDTSQAHVVVLACTPSHCDRWLMELGTMTSSIPSLVSLKDSISLCYHHQLRQPQHKAIISRLLVLREENHPTTTLTTKKTS